MTSEQFQDAERPWRISGTHTGSRRPSRKSTGAAFSGSAPRDGRMSSSLSPEQITIAVTVFNRRAFLRQAVASALDQRVPVKVIVVEDCGPDPTSRDLVRREFGARVGYFLNARRRGIFGAANACVELCPTPWLSILHDDDYLAPEFVEAMLELHRHCP